MNHRYFNTIMPLVNHIWLADAMNMQVNRQKGPDLISNLHDCEVKFTLKSDEGNYPVAWTVMEHQIKYETSKKPIYWALGMYWLRKPVCEIPSSANLSMLEKLVEKREVYIVPWNFMFQYPPHKTSGKSKKTGEKWKNIFRYPKFKDVPIPIETYQVNKGIIHVVEDVDRALLQIKSSQVLAKA